MHTEAKAWLWALFERHGLDGPDERPLYAYRCSEADYAELSRLTGPAVAATVENGASRGVPDALLCLFAAEWIRRRYSGGQLRYADILAAAAVPVLAYPVIQDFVQRGLRFWRRPLLRVGQMRGFLVTLACEGGLPMQFLHREQATLRRFFRALLKDVQTYAGADLSPETLAAQRASHLPRSLRQDMVYSLAGEIAATVWSLQPHIGGQTDPIAALTRAVPNWRQRFPLELSDRTAQGFLEGLVSTATEIAGGGETSLRLVRELHRSEAGWQLQARVELPGLLSERDAAGLLGRPMSSRLELMARLAKEPPVLLGWASVTPRGLLVEPARRAPTWEGPAAAVAFELGVREHACGVSTASLQGGEPLERLPWIFVDNDGDGTGLILRGQGSLRTRHQTAWVATAPDDTLNPHAGAEVEAEGDLQELERRLFRIRGQVDVFNGEGERCRICTGATQASEETFRLQGKPAPLARSARPLFVGLPKLIGQDADGVSRLIQTSQLQWRAQGSGAAWQTLDTTCVGDGELRFVEDGDLRFRTRLGLLPEGFGVQYEPGLRPHGGRIRVRTVSAAAVGLEPLPGVSAQQVAGPGAEAVLDIRADGYPPATLVLSVRWPSGAGSRFSLTFPAGGARFLAPDGTTLSSGALVPRDRLSGIRVRVVSPTGSGRFVLSGSLNAWDLSLELARAVWVREPIPAEDGTNGRVHELDLLVLQDDLLTMLSASKGLDAHVILRVEGPNVDEQAAFIRVARYDLELEPLPDRSAVRLNPNSLAQLDVATLSRLQVGMFPVWAPEVGSVGLEQSVTEGVPTGVWPIASESIAPGPWLVTAQDGCWSRARPLLVTIPAAVGDEHDDALDAEALAGRDLAGAIRIADNDPRKRALAATVAVLREDCLAADWELVAALIKSFSGLPPSALDLFPLLAEDPVAAVLTLLKTAPSEVPDLLAFFERLPFSWRLVPVRAWLDAGRRHIAALRGQLQSMEDSTALIAGAIDGVFCKAAEHYPYLALLHELLDREVYGWLRKGQTRYLPMAAASAGRDVLRQQLREAQQELLLAHSDDGSWPPGRALAEWVSRYTSENRANRDRFLETPPGTGFRRPVQDAPIVAALISAHDLPTTPRLVFEILSLRGYDKRWFDDAYRLTLMLVLGATLEPHADPMET